MLTGEYFVLDGAKSLALPTKFGQKMKVSSARGSDLSWKSLDQDGNIWFQAQISLYDFKAVKTNDETIAEGLHLLLKNAVRLNSEFLNNWKAFKVETQLEFPRDWGLGSSSSLTHLLAQWADVNPFLLHFKVSNGSGYDIACAGADAPIIYTLKDDALHYEEIDFQPSFHKHLYFVHLNEKQSSKEAVDFYNKKVKGKKKIAKEITNLTNALISAEKLQDFQRILEEHETIVSTAIQQPTIKSARFADFEGTVKSLGAWGGDFVLVASELPEKEIKKYFAEKSYTTIISYENMLVK